MLFTQLQFWLFFFPVLALTVLALRFAFVKGHTYILLLASWLFYGLWDWRFLSLIIISTIVVWVLSQRIDTASTSKRRRRWLLVSLTFSIGLLCLFKYLGFFISSFIDFIGLFGIPVAFDWSLQILLPLGISFYTFQSIGYTIDVYRHKFHAEPDFVNFAVFISFFPTLIAGPIQRAGDLLPQIRDPRPVVWDDIGRGTILCLLGLIKKIVIADALAPSVAVVYGAPDPNLVGGADVIIATWLYAIQIYCDFSGYTDIARGVARGLGFDLKYNFLQPYFATSPQEFWRRWHISLSSWLRDYLYIPLGGNRRGDVATNRNLLVTMVLGGLWHGAAWNFVLWGVFQGVIQVGQRLSGLKVQLPCEPIGGGVFQKGKHILKVVLFFQVTAYGWLLFRATSFEQIAVFSRKIISSPLSMTDHLLMFPPVPSICAILFLFVWDLCAELVAKQNFYWGWSLAVRATLWATMFYLFAFGATVQTTGFIYAQF